MKAWTLVRHGDPLKAFSLQERTAPEPLEGQVLVQSEGFGLNYADVMAARGLYREAPPLPSVIGYEVVGRIVGAGPAVPEGLVGKRIAALTRFGGYAQLAVTDHRACTIVPEDLPLGVALALPTQGCTAWYAARILCPLRKGERVLVHSAAGGVGHLLVQLAANSGCEVIAVVGNKDKIALAQRSGARHVIDRSVGNVEDRLRQLLNGKMLDASFNAVGGSTFRTDLSLLGAGGRLVLFGGAERGSLAAVGALRFVWRMGIVVPIFLMMRSRSLLGVNMLHLADRRPDLIAECLAGITEAQRTGVVAPHVHDLFPAADLPKAISALASGNTMGKVCVRW
jgi:NADPH2:quinone reductase